jgi:formimidoylglutamate deiminase
MARSYRLEAALLGERWVRGPRVTVADDGYISRIEVSPAEPGEDAEPLAGFIVPGMPNGHSHAFQRGMAGDTEFRLSDRDSFWTWRNAMYALANRIEAADLEVLATQLYVEMLKAGYTSVAEFHYLHRRTDGTLDEGSNQLWDATTAAAGAAGIGLTFLPTLYQASDFGAQPLRRDQARFELETRDFLRLIDQRTRAEKGQSLRRTGAAFHSLRAVPLPALAESVSALRSLSTDLPLHIHIAEQRKEVEACQTSSGRRPIELLLETGAVDRHWCLVHATHATAAELKGIADCGATVCVSITTEANLGDGFFDSARFLKLGGRLCVGSDSQITVCPAEELRWMEYQMRLRKRRRSVLADRREPHVGTRLWREASQAGALALGQPTGSIAVGARADWLVLDRDHPSMAGAVEATALDHLLFAGGSAAISDVMVGGQWVVRGGLHELEGSLRPAFGELMRRLGIQPH